MGHLGSIGVTSTLRLLAFLPRPGSLAHTRLAKGARTQSLCECRCATHTPEGAAGCSQGSRIFGGSHHTVYWPLILDPVRFHPGLGVGGVFSLQFASGEFVG